MALPNRTDTDGDPRSSKQEAVLLLSGEPCSFGIVASLVRRAVSPVDWHGEPPLDVARALGIHVPADAEPARVLIVDVGGSELPLLVRGSIRLQPVTPNEVLELPPMLRDAHPFQGVLSLDGVAVGVLVDLWRLDEQARR